MLDLNNPSPQDVAASQALLAQVRALNRVLSTSDDRSALAVTMVFAFGCLLEHRGVMRRSELADMIDVTASTVASIRPIGAEALIQASALAAVLREEAPAP